MSLQPTQRNCARQDEFRSAVIYVDHFIFSLIFAMCDISKSVEYTQQTMDVALTKVKKIEANLGGTEILKPLKHIFSQTCIPGQPRQVMEFTQCKHTCLLLFYLKIQMNWM